MHKLAKWNFEEMWPKTIHDAFVISIKAKMYFIDLVPLCMEPHHHWHKSWFTDPLKVLSKRKMLKPLKHKRNLRISNTNFRNVWLSSLCIISIELPLIYAMIVFIFNLFTSFLFWNMWISYEFHMWHIITISPYQLDQPPKE